MVSSVGTKPAMVVRGRATAPPNSRWVASVARTVNSSEILNRPVRYPTSTPRVIPASPGRNPVQPPKAGWSATTDGISRSQTPRHRNPAALT